MELIFIIVIVLFGFYFNNRVKRLEREVKELRGGVVAPHSSVIGGQVPTAQFAHQESSVVDRISQAIPVPQKSSEPSSFEAFGAWVKEDWLLKLGAFIVLLGFGWFVSYAFMQDWIGPTGRVTLGMVVGIGILGFGWVRMHLYARQGSVFLGLGAVVVLISAFSAAHIYTLISGHAALGIAFLTSAFVALASVRFSVHSLAVTSIIIAGIAPSVFLIGSTATATELFAYLFAIALGTVWIVSLTGWRDLTAVALVLFFLHSLSYLGIVNREPGILLWFAYAFAILFFITNTIGILKSDGGGIKADAITAAGNGLLLLAWINAGAAPEWKSLIMVGWMVIFVVVAFAVFAITKRREPFFVYAGVGLSMLAAATTIDFEGVGLTIAYTLESVTTSLVAYAVTRDRNIAKILTLLIIGPALLSLQSIGANWYLAIPGDHFFVLLILSASLLLLGVFFLSIQREGDEGDVSPALFVGGSIYAYILLWLSLHATMADDTATMISLVIYTIIGLVSYAYGRMNDLKGVHYYGGVLLAFVVGHLLLVDVWHMELTGKIVTFFVVGALLMGTAFMSKKKN